jgi:hypothetical protein
MKPMVVLAALVVALAAPAGFATAAAAAPTASAEDIELAFDKDQVDSGLGDRFVLRTRITNNGSAPTDVLLAHLNVASLTNDVYVDPEDWSPDRSHDLGPLAPGASTELSWDIQAVNAGSIDIYVVLLPNGAGSAGKGPLVVSPPVHLEVAGRRTLSPAGTFPVAIVVPILLGLAAAGARFRIRDKG